MNASYLINVPIYSKTVSLPTKVAVLYLFKFKYSIFDIHEQN